MDVYSDSFIKRAHDKHSDLIMNMYQLYPYDEYGEKCFRRAIYKFNIYKNNYLYDECYSRCAQAYIFTLCSLCTKNHTSEYVYRYMYCMMKIYIICVFNTNRDIAYICKENNLVAVDVDNYTV